MYNREAKLGSMPYQEWGSSAEMMFSLLTCCSGSHELPSTRIYATALEGTLDRHPVR